MPLSDFYFKKLGKMIHDPDYDLNEKFAPRLLDLGCIKSLRYSAKMGGAILSFSEYVITDKGKYAYEEWKNNLKR